MNWFKVPAPMRNHQRFRVLIIAAAFIVVFIPSRLFLLAHFTPIGSDVDLYARYSFIHARAHEMKCPFYDLYRSEGLKDRTYAGYSLRDLTDIPYPPLAIGFLSIPGRLILLGKSTDAIEFKDFVTRYQKTYRWICVPFDVCIVLLALWLVITLFRGEGTVCTLVRSGMACGAAALLPHLLYDRLDIVLSALLLLSLIALMKKRWIIAFLLFAVAVNFKPLPLFLAPLWVAGSLSAVGLEGRRRWAYFVKQFVARGIFLGLMTAIICVAALVADGGRGMGFLVFHGARGIHIESFWGTFSLLAADLFNLPFRIVYDYGAFNVVTSWTSFCAKTTTVLMIVLTAGLTFMALLPGLTNGGDSRPYACWISNKSLVSIAAATLLVIFCTFKMFSPQFLLLLVPLIPILPWRGPLFILSCVLFTGACCMSTYIYPYFYVQEIISGPTLFGHFLLVARESMLVALLCVIVAAEFIPKSLTESGPDKA